MALDPKKIDTDKKDDMQKKRRNFLKKTVYRAPSLIILGQLARPTQSKAWGEQLPSDPQVP